MPSIRELFNKRVKGLTGGLYEKSKIYIESQGIINPPRLKALALSSPNAVADLAGIVVAAALGIPISSAKRPGDIIYSNPKWFNKPLIGLAGPMAERNTGIISTTRSYYVKPAPAPYQVVNQIKNGIKTNPLGTLITAAKNELRDGTLREIFAKRTDVKDKYGTLHQHLGTRTKPLERGENSDKDGNLTFSGAYPEYKQGADKYKSLIPQIVGKKRSTKDPKSYTQQTLVLKRVNSVVADGVSKWDFINQKLLAGGFVDVAALDTDNKNVNIPYVAFEFYGKTGKDAYILLPGTVSGLSEDIAPTWNTYKYVGSPFNTYRYNGVERSIKFELKLYTVGGKSLDQIKINLDKLRKTTFPDQRIAKVAYGNDAAITTSYNPNLVYLTISGYYKKVLGFMESLSFSVDDSTPWATTDETFDGVKETPYPVVVNVSVSMKVIEQTRIKDDQINFNFTGEKYNKDAPDEYTPNEEDGGDNSPYKFT